MAYDTYEAARLVSWSNRQAGLEPLSEAELIEWIDSGVGGLEWTDAWEEDGEIQRYIDFPTLISLRMICLLRSAKFSLKDIAEIASLSKERTGLTFPFANRSYWDLSSDKSISTIGAIGVPSDAVMGALIALLDGVHSQGQLEFDEGGTAYAWRPVKDVVIDARVVSGSPCVAGTRTPTWVVTGVLNGGDNIEELANGYRLSKEQVWNALDWERRLDADSS